MYTPLPKFLTIKDSGIHGLGLFATEDIPKDTNLGTSHVKLHSEWVRTPLGGFYNHSENPNCVKHEKANMFQKWMDLVTTKDIKKGEEITVRYTLYKIN